MEKIILKLYNCKKNHPVHVFRVYILYFNNLGQKMNWREKENRGAWVKAFTDAVM